MRHGRTFKYHSGDRFSTQLNIQQDVQSAAQVGTNVSSFVRTSIGFKATGEKSLAKPNFQTGV